MDASFRTGQQLWYYVPGGIALGIGIAAVLSRHRSNDATRGTKCGRDGNPLKIIRFAGLMYETITGK